MLYIHNTAKLAISWQLISIYILARKASKEVSLVRRWNRAFRVRAWGRQNVRPKTRRILRSWEGEQLFFVEPSASFHSNSLLEIRLRQCSNLLFFSDRNRAQHIALWSGLSLRTSALDKKPRIAYDVRIPWLASSSYFWHKLLQTHCRWERDSISLHQTLGHAKRRFRTSGLMIICFG